MVFNAKQNYTLGFLISILIYFSIVFGIFMYVNSNELHVKKYTSKKDDFLEVSIVQKNHKTTQIKEQKKPINEIKKQELIQKEQKQVEEVKVNENTEIKEKKSQPNVQNLFEKITLKPTKTIKKENKKIEKKNLPQKTNKASKIAQNLNFENSVSLNSSNSSGEFDEFKGKIQEILQSHWASTIDTIDGSSANVKIIIDKNGNFSYDIVNLSYNNTFNEKLLAFLQQMQKVQFPKNDKNVPFLNITFSDKMELR